MGDRDDAPASRRDISRRQTLILTAIGGSGAIAGCNSSNEPATADSDYVSDAVKTNIEDAVNHFDQNYQLLSDVDLSSPEGLYLLETEQMDKHLDSASVEINKALNKTGQSPPPLLVEANNYLLYQDDVHSALDIPEGDAGEYIIDDRLRTIIEAAKTEVESNSKPSPQEYTQDPYNIEGNKSRLKKRESLFPLRELEELLSHDPLDLIDAVNVGFSTASEIAELYRMFRAHVLLPTLDEYILKIDRELSQTTDLGEAAAKWGPQLTNQLNKAGVASEAKISKELANKRVGQRSFTAGDMEKAHNELVTAFAHFETSITALYNGNHEDSTEHWSRGLGNMYAAQKQTPL